jgi:hypothetical protein
MSSREQPMTCNLADELAGAFAFGALDALEERAIGDHLLTCPQPHQELRQAAGAGLLLAASLEPLDPPSALRSRILQTVADRERPAPVASAPARRAWWPRALTALAATAVIVLGVWNIGLRNELAARDAQLTQLTATLAAGAPAYLASGDAGSGYVIATTEPILVAVLNPTAGTDLYEMWLIDAEGTPVGVGTFTVVSAEQPAVVTLEQPMGGFTTFALTVEQSRVDAPTSAPVLVAPLGS